VRRCDMIGGDMETCLRKCAAEGTQTFILGFRV
jgi:hypothetical protein